MLLLLAIAGGLKHKMKVLWRPSRV